MSDASVLSDHVREEIDRWKARFPEDRQRSAVIGALHAVQHENDGYLTAELMNGVANYLDLPTIQVYEVATFYSMFQTKPVGRHNVAICTNVACMLRGAEDIVSHVEKKLGIKTFGMVDTNSDPTLVDFPVPSNDDASKAISYVVNYLVAAINEGLEERKSMKGEEKDAE